MMTTNDVELKEKLSHFVLVSHLATNSACMVFQNGQMVHVSECYVNETATGMCKSCTTGFSFVIG